MPIYIEDDNFQTTVYQFTDGKLDYSTQSMNYFRDTWDFPSTVRRKKPVDLFASGTYRKTTTSIENGSTCNTARKPNSRDLVLSYGVHPSTWWYSKYKTHDPSLPPVDLERVYNTIRMSIRGDATNLAMAVAEYRQTAALYGALAKAVSSKGRSLAGALKTKRGVSKAWLGFQYGVKPHVSDILGSINDLKNACTQPVYMHGRESRSANAMKSGDLRDISTWFDVHGRVESHIQRRTRVRYRAKYNPNPAFNVLVRAGFTNPFALAYELIPYSFVLDWWINVGDVLASLDNLLLFDKLEVISSESLVYARYVTSGGQLRNTATSFVTGHNWTKIDRTDTRSGPGAISLLVVPRYKPSVSLTHITNGLALLHTARGRFPSTRR